MSLCEFKCKSCGCYTLVNPCYDCLESKVERLKAERDRYLGFILEWKDVLKTNMTEVDFQQALKGE